MRVADVMSFQPTVVDALDTVQEAAQRMRANVVGMLPVLDHERLVGIVTDRDLALRVVAPGERPWETYVHEVMTPRPLTCRPDELIERVVARMVQRRVRRVIVVDAAGAVAGVLSVDDLVLIDEMRTLALVILRQIAATRGELDGAVEDIQP